MTKKKQKKGHQKFLSTKAAFFQKSTISSRKSSIFSQKVRFFREKVRFFPGKVRFFRKIFTNLTWGFLGFFSGPSRVLDFFRVATLNKSEVDLERPVICQNFWCKSFIRNLFKRNSHWIPQQCLIVISH